MELPRKVGDALHYPLVTLSGGVVTPGSVLVAVAILLVSIAIAIAADRWIRRVLERRDVHAGALFAASKIARYVIILLGAVIAVNSMGVRLDALIAASTVLAVGIGFGLQNIAQNFVSGVILLVEQPVRKGDFVRVGDALGTVDDIGLRATHIVTRDEVTIIVPNSNLVAGLVINHSRPTSNLRLMVKVGVAYDSDLRKVRELLMAVANDTPMVLVEPEPEVRLEGFGDSSLDMGLYVWISNPRHDLKVASALRFGIERVFREAQIDIPFPQRDVHVRDAPPPAPKPTGPEKPIVSATTRALRGR